MPDYLRKLLFPHDRRATRERKMRILWVTLVLGAAASALVGYMFYWACYSGRF
jgi:high-affinity Fe2+/Pb2+ permease